MSLELFPLATMVAELREPKVLPKTPAGTRMIYEVESGHNGRWSRPTTVR